MEAAQKTSSPGQHLDHGIPADIIFHNILSRIPVKSLCRWKCVSKPWCNFIQDPVFADEIRPKTRPQWIRLPPPRSELPLSFFTDVGKREVDEKYDMDIHIYSVDKKGAETILNKHVCPPDTFLVKQYPGLVCSYHGSFQLTVFNTTTQESVNISLPLIKDLDFFRNFEYELDPLSEKYKVFTYTYDYKTVDVDPMDVEYNSPSNFQIITFGEETPTWKSLKHIPKIQSLPGWVTVANGKLFWFLKSRKHLKFGEWSETAQIISFNLATEEFATISLPKTEVHMHFKRPLLQHEEFLCYVENACIGQKEKFQFPLNVWMLKDADNGVWDLMAKNMVLSLNGTNLKTLGTPYWTMEDIEFSIQDGELVLAAYDNKDQYVYSCSFLNGQCKRMKINGQPFKHPTVEKYIDVGLSTI